MFNLYENELILEKYAAKLRIAKDFLIHFLCIVTSSRLHIFKTSLFWRNCWPDVLAKNLRVQNMDEKKVSTRKVFTSNYVIRVIKKFIYFATAFLSFIVVTLFF